MEYLKPSRMDQPEFIAAFGGIFEHSPWIAQRAFNQGIDQDCDTAVGLHTALAKKFQSANPEERFGVLKAHPDLAGKLAAAKRLTAESTNEQASAGLDALTDEQRRRFAELNASYVTKHGFPFIIAVKGLDKDQILAAFEARIGNDHDAEFVTACEQVERIALLRLKDLLPE